MQNEEKKYDLIKFEDGEFSLDVKVSPEEDTVWLSQKQICSLFESSKANISEHINHILAENELDDSVVRNFRTTASDGKTYTVKCYNLDMIIAIGYRVNSKRGTQFRKWANSVLKEYLIKGYSINNERCLTHSTSIQNLTTEVIMLKNELIGRITKLEEIVFGKNVELIFEGEIVEPYTLIRKLFFLAKKELIIIDNYADDFLLSMLKDVKVNITIITNTSSYLNNKEVPSNIKVIYSDVFHDRFIIADEMIYAIGASLNSIGKKRFGIIRIKGTSKDELLKNIK